MKDAWIAATQDNQRALFWAALRANVKPLLFCIIPRLLQIGFKNTQPFLLTRTIAFANDESQPDNIGWGLTGAFFIVLLGVAVSNGVFYHMTFRFVTSLRGSLVSIIYSKTVDLSVTALDESVAVTLMSSDVQAICNGFQLINDLWGVPLELAIVIYLLTRQLGILALVPAILSFISTVAIISMAKSMGHAQKIWMKSIQTRVDVTSTMLGSMKSVKMLGFTDWLTGIVQGLRVSELQEANLFRRLLVLRVFLANSLKFLAPPLTFAIFATIPQNGHSLNVNSVYTTLSLISLLATPINTFIRAIPAMNTALASFNRIQEFLQSESRRDHRVILGDSSASTQQAQSSSEGLELSDLSPLKQNSVSEVIIARDLSFAWGNNTTFSVSNVNMSVQQGQFCFIIGSTGCGKSTLIKGVLGETQSTKGFLYAKYRDTAFVDQTPWIRNTSFRDNILGVLNYTEKWYNEVVSACGLNQDVANLPNGHCELTS
jgi:ABC-type multidrug transport system fused ATPase/permease subunit